MIEIIEKIQTFYELARKERQVTNPTAKVTPMYFIIDDKDKVLETPSILQLQANTKHIIGCTLQVEFVTWQNTPLSRIFTFFNNQGESMPCIELENWNIVTIEFCSNNQIDFIVLQLKLDYNISLKLDKDFFQKAKRSIPMQQLWEMLLAIDRFNNLPEAKLVADLFISNINNRQLQTDLRDTEFDLHVKRNTIDRMEKIMEKIENLLK